MPISEYENNLTVAKWKGMFVPALRKVRRNREKSTYIPASGEKVKFRSIVFPNLCVDLILKVSTERGVFDVHAFYQRILL